MNTDSTRHIHVCPLCGGELERVHRHLGDRLLGAFRSVHRYQCVNDACTWEGIVSDELPIEAGGAARLTWRSRLLWMLIGVTVALAAVQSARMYSQGKVSREALRNRAATMRQPLPPLPVDIGETYDGEVLVADDPRQVTNRTPLTLRRGCAWGVPGRNPYQGTVAQALQAARLPESAIKKLESMVTAKLVSDRVEITREHITTVGKRRQFDTLSFDMAFGKTMCFGARVNFKHGHVEMADLYEATDADGRHYAVMIPDVCGNVSVLGDREDRPGPPPDRPTPEPATLALFAGALGLLAWFSRRHVHRSGARLIRGGGTPRR